MGHSGRLVEVIAIVSMFALTLSMYLVWAVAFVSDGSTTIFIDRYGERFLELVVWTFVIPVVAVGLHSYFARLRTEGSGVDVAESTENGDS